MKRSFTAVLCAVFLLCGCAKRVDEQSAAADRTSLSAATSESGIVTEKNASKKPETADAEAGAYEYHEKDEYTIEFVEPETELSCSDMDSMTEAQLLEIAQSDVNWYISDLVGKELLDGSFSGSINVIPSDKEGWESTVERLSVPNVDKYEEHVFEISTKTDDYIVVSSSYTEIRSYYSNDTLVESHIEREYFYIILKELCRSDSYLNYSGKMSAEEVQRCFDLFNLVDSTDTPLCRKVQETEAAFVYEIYNFNICYGDWGLNDEACLNRDVYTIDKQTGEVSLMQYRLLSAEIPNTASDTPVPELE